MEDMSTTEDEDDGEDMMKASTSSPGNQQVQTWSVSSQTSGGIPPTEQL